MVFLIIFIGSTGIAGCCASIAEHKRAEYGVLKSGVEASAHVVIGEYEEDIPPDFDAPRLLILVKGNIPDLYYEALEKYAIVVHVKGDYYLLIARDRETKKMILFDYSCTAPADGLVYQNPDKFDLNHLDKYDPCKPGKVSKDKAAEEDQNRVKEE